MAEGNSPMPFESMLNTYVIAGNIGGNATSIFEMTGNTCAILGMRNDGGGHYIFRMCDYWNTAFYNIDGTTPTDVTYSKSANSKQFNVTKTTSGQIPIIMIGCRKISE